MPDFGVTEILSLAAILASGAGTGAAIYEGGQNRDAATAAAKLQEQTQLQQQDATKAADAKQGAASIASGAGNIQSATGGATTPEYDASVTGASGGIGDPNILQTAVNNWLGQSGNAPAGGSATPGSSSPSTGAGAGGTNFFPNAAVPALAPLLQSGGGAGDNQQQTTLSGGSS